MRNVVEYPGNNAAPDDKHHDNEASDLPECDRERCEDVTLAERAVGGGRRSGGDFLQQLDERRASVRFEPTPDAPTDGKAIEETTAAPSPRPKPASPSQLLGPQAAEQEDYTSRLLKAKKRVWDDRKQNDE